MRVIAIFSGVLVCLILAGMMLAVLNGIVARRITMRGLLLDSFTGRPSVARVQGLLLSFGIALTYLGIAIGNLMDGAGPVLIPAVPDWMLPLFGTSHLGYLASKGWSAFIIQKNRS